MLPRDCEGQPVIGRASLDVFSPVREGLISLYWFNNVEMISVNVTTVIHCVSDCQTATSAHRKTPLGTPLVASVGRCFSPLSVYQTPPIKEEEPAPAIVAESGDITKVQTQTCENSSVERCRITGFHLQPHKTSSSSLEGEVHTTPPSSHQTNLSQPAPPFFTPEPSLRRANSIQNQLSYDSPTQRATEAGKPMWDHLSTQNNHSWMICASNSIVRTFRFGTFGSRILFSLPEHRGGGWTGRSCSSHLPADPLHPKYDSWNSGGL